MPKKNGFEVLEEIQKDPKLKKIPVLILSNLGQDEDIKKGMSSGAKDYIVKASTSMEDVLKMIKKHL
jgi:DNA-binding response OmpR family regulator